MSGNQREQSVEKGFWKGGPSMKESAGQSSGYPGARKPKRIGFRIDLERPMPKQPSGEKDQAR